MLSTISILTLTSPAYSTSHDTNSTGQFSSSVTGTATLDGCSTTVSETVSADVDAA